MFYGDIFLYVNMQVTDCHWKYGPGNVGPAGPKLLWENRSGRTILTGNNGPGPGVLVRLVRRCYSSASQVQDTGSALVSVLLLYSYVVTSLVFISQGFCMHLLLSFFCV